MVREAEQFSVRGPDIQSLRRAVEVVSRTLAGKLAVEVAFIVLLATVISLIDGNGDEPRLEQFDDFRIGEGRRTVDDSVVSRTAQWVPIHGPNEDRFFLLSRYLPGFQ